MKNLPIILSSIALVGVLFLFGKSFTGAAPKATKVMKTDSSGKKVEVEVELSRIAYIDLDTIDAKYKKFQAKKKEFEGREKKINVELENMAKAIEKDLINVQKKAQAGTLTEDEYKNADKRLANKKQALDTKRNSLGKQLLKDQEEFSKMYTKKLKDLVAEYNKDNKYDFILTHMEGGSIVYLNESLDITNDILELLNEN
jgi:outer membrane protein